MSIPTLRAGDGQASIPELAARCVELMNAYPYFVLISDRAAEDSPAFTRALTGEIAGDAADIGNMTLSRIELDPEKAASTQDATSHSRTAEALGAHTDSSFHPRPHEVVAFQFVRDDPQGGDTIMIPLDDALARLGAEMTAAAERVAFRFGETETPMLTTADGVRSLRFYRTQIEKSAGGPLTGDRLALVEAMSAATDVAHEDFRFHADPGDVVLINNTKTLHGRTAFTAGSDRLMFRVRCNSRLVK